MFTCHCENYVTTSVIVRYVVTLHNINCSKKLYENVLKELDIYPETWYMELYTLHCNVLRKINAKINFRVNDEILTR